MGLRTLFAALLLIVAASLLPAGQENGLAPLGIEISKPDETGAIGIQLTFEGDISGETQIQFTQWASLTDLTDHIDGLEVQGLMGPLRAKVTGNGEWLVRHQPYEPLVVSYRLIPNDRQATSSSRQFYRPIVNDTLFHASGNNFLALPKHFTGEVDLTLTWSGFGDWSTLTSLGSLGTSLRTQTETRYIYNSLYVAGPIQIVERDISGNPIYVSLHGEDWGFTVEELADLVEKVAQKERDYFADHDFPFYWVSAIGVGEPLKSGYQFNGTKLHNNFALFLNPSTVFEYDLPTGSPIISLLAHEMMHVWFGGKLIPEGESPEGTYAWFTEGFTNYFTNRVLLESGLLTETQYVNTLNQLLGDYNENPARRSPNANIPDNFWKSADYQILPYQRGELVALALERALESQSLKDLALEWLADERWSLGFGLEEFSTSIEGRVSDTQYDALMAVIVDGADIDWALFPGHGCLSIDDTEVATWDSGFDHNASFQTRVITGVREDSAAWRAGLRDGQRILGGSMTINDLVNPITITVDDAPDDIRFMPFGEPVRLPQLRLLSPGCL